MLHLQIQACHRHCAPLHSLPVSFLQEHCCVAGWADLRFCHAVLLPGGLIPVAALPIVLYVQPLLF
ncbi:hypothetical protein D3C86_1330280 [compost metagenome]